MAKRKQQRSQYFPGKKGGIAAKTAEMVSEKMRHEYIIDLNRGTSAHKDRRDQDNAFFAFEQGKSSESGNERSPLFRNASDATAITPVEYYKAIPQGKLFDQDAQSLQMSNHHYNHVRNQLSAS